MPAFHTSTLLFQHIEPPLFPACGPVYYTTRYKINAWYDKVAAEKFGKPL